MVRRYAKTQKWFAVMLKLFLYEKERDREKCGYDIYKDDRELKSELPAGSMKVGSYFYF